MLSEITSELKRNWLISLFGCAIFCTGVGVIVWGESKAVKVATALDEAYRQAVSLAPYEGLRPELDGRLVHITGELAIGEPLTEPDYGISMQAVKLRRRVQMYQWIEESVKPSFGDSVAQQHSDDYVYYTEWRDKLVDSDSFYIRTGHHNPKELPLKSTVHVASDVRLGAFYLGAAVKHKFHDYVEMTGDERPERRDIKLHMGIYYHCADVWNPEVGDIRVQFYYAGHLNEPVTVVAQQKAGHLVPFFTAANEEVLIVRSGKLTVQQVFDLEHSAASDQAWKCRLVGWFLFFCAVNCLERPILLVAARLPLLRTLQPGVFTNFSISLYFFLCIGALAWISTRPVLSGSVFMCALSPMLYGVFLHVNNNGGGQYHHVN